MRPLLLCAALLCSVFVARAGELKVTLSDIEGEQRTVVLMELTTDGIRTDSGDVAYKDLSKIEFDAGSQNLSHDVVPMPSIYLRNGDILKASVKSGDDTKLTVNSKLAGEQQIAFKFLRGIAFPIKEGPPADAIADFFAGPSPKEDLLMMLKGETIRGVYEKMNETEIHFNVGGQSRPFTFDKVAAFRLAPLEDFTPAKEFRGTIELGDGSRLTGKLQNLKAGKLSFEVVTGEAWTVATDSVNSIAFEGGKLVSLSSLKPASVEERPFVGGSLFIHRWKKDLAADGQKLRIATRDYARGIGAHSYSKLTFDLGGKYARFLCHAGIAAQVPAGASMDWKVIVDGKTAASGSAQSGGGPEVLKLDIAGAKQLELICDFGADQDDSGDLFNWADARLIKQ